MKRKLDLCLFVGVVWMLTASRIQGEEIEDHLLSSAAQGHHEKGAASFEHVHSLAMDAAGQTLFLGAHTGLFKSDDDGRSWQRVALSAKHSHPDVMAVTPHPKDSTMIYLGTHEAGVLKSTDDGRTWVEVNTGLKGLDVHGLALDPNKPAKLHAAIREEGEGIYRTIDGGGRWVRVDDSPQAEVKVLTSVNIPTGMGGIFLYAGTSEGLQRNPDCF